MIVFDLRCDGGHVFEGWFASSSAYDEQVARSLITCPMCASSAIGKAVMAPAVAAKGNSRAAPVPGEIKDALARLARAQAEALDKSTWVGPTFARRARAMHEGEEPQAIIHGQATAAEAKELIDDGVAIMPLPLPVIPPDRQN